MTDNADDFSGILDDKNEIKDPKGSIRRKYKTRLRNLASTLDDFISHAEQRLDPDQAGKIYKRAEVEKLLTLCQALRAEIPVKNPQDEELPSELFNNFCDLLGIDADSSGDPSQ